MSEGITGADVSQLNHDLVALADASKRGHVRGGLGLLLLGDGVGVQQMEGHLGVSIPPGSLSLGQVVFEPRALRVARVTGSLGGPASGPVLQATSDGQVVTIPLDVSQESEVTGGGRGDGDAAGRNEHAGRGVLGRHGGDHVHGSRTGPPRRRSR